MITKDFKGYIEGLDITKIPAQNLAFPSKNCIVHKGKVLTRQGITVLGDEGDIGNAIHSEYVWKDSKSGEMPMRVYGTVLQLNINAFKDDEVWIDLLTGLDSDIERLEFATWTDINTTIIKKRCFMVDGSNKIYQWAGGVGVIASESGANITISGDKTFLQLGFDTGAVTAQTVIINGEEIGYTSNPTTKTITLSSAPSTAPSAGDLIIIKPVTITGNLTAIDKDHIYSYKNHIVIGNLDSNNLYFSDTVAYTLAPATGLSFTIPAPSSRTAISPMYFTLDANITAMRERKGILWVSTVDDWLKITKLFEQNGFDEWATVKKVESAERMGALPFAVSGHKGDMLFIGQDSTVQSISDLELLQSDQIKLISDDIEATLLRYDLTNARIYYNGRYIYITIPIESILLMLDVVEGHWQPPQTMPISRFSLIGGVKVGHSNDANTSFKLFDGRNDLGADIETIIAFGYQGYTSKTDELEYKSFSTIGFSGRITETTKVSVKIDYETDGAKDSTEIEIDGAKIKKYNLSADASWGTNPFAFNSWAGGDVEISDLKRFLVFSKYNEVSFFEWRPVITITGKSQEFHLLAMSVDVTASDTPRGNDLYIEK